MKPWSFEDDLRALRQELDPDEAALRQLRAARAARRRSPPRRARLAWGLAALAAAALAALWIRGSDRLDLALDAPVWEDRALSEGVDLRFQGRGLAQGSAKEPVIHWEEGTISLAVRPGEGLTVRVQTPEAEVLVVGTRFDVARDGLGTAVSVEEGRVSVNCSDGTTRFLTPGQRLSCARSAAAALATARALAAEGADPAEVLDTVQRGLGRADADEAVRDELRFLQVSALQAMDRDSEALEAAEAALDRGAPPRWRALAAIAARLRVQRGDCAGARPHLERLTAGEDDPVALVLLADCLAPTDPAAARRALLRALGQDLQPEQAAAVKARLAALPD